MSTNQVRIAINRSAVIVALIAGPLCHQGLHAAGPATPAAANAAPVGTPSCSARACHGAIEPHEGRRILRNEYTTWNRTDKHADAYRTLFGDLAQQIMKRLSLPGETKPAHENARCLACHSLPTAAKNKDLVWMRLDGVGCEACHGSAQQWLDLHTAPAQWSKLTPPEKLKRGMIPSSQPLALAAACAGCHVGAPADAAAGIPQRDVNHDLLAAGHPRLNFEFTSFLANLPPHWKGATRSAPPDLVPNWLAGQVVSARMAVQLLADRAKATAKPSLSGSWPELAEYDCFSCHHALRQPSWRQLSTGARRPAPGRWQWGSWYFPMLTVIPGDRPGDHDALTALRNSMESSSPSAAEVQSAADQLAKKLQDWELRLDAIPAEQARRDLTARLSRDGPSFAPASWDFAVQLAFGASILDRARPVRDPHRLEALFRDLRFPTGGQSPEQFEWGARLESQLDLLLQRSDNTRE